MPVTGTDWLQAQNSVLGAALIEPSLVPKVIQETRLSDFSGPAQTIYGAMRRLFQQGTPVDVVSLAAALGSEYRGYMMQMMEITPSAANIDSYIQLCREQAKVMSVRSLASRISTAEDSETIRKLLEEANGLMVDKPSLQIWTMQDALKDFIFRHTREVSYLPWPIKGLNDLLFCESGDFILLGGIPSSGKSALALQCARYWARTMKVGFFSLETPKPKVFDRQMSSTVKIPMSGLKTNVITQDEWDRFGSMSGQVSNLQLELIPAADMTPADIRSVTMMRGYQLIIIDYVQLLLSSGGNRTEQVTNISMALHRMAQSMGVTVVGLSQLKRQDGNSAPDSSDLRESGQLEQDADVIMILTLAEDKNYAGPRKLYITKNKEGTTPCLTLDFDGSHQTFYRLMPGEKPRQQQRNDSNPRRISGSPNQMSMLPPNTPVPFPESGGITTTNGPEGKARAGGNICGCCNLDMLVTAGCASSEVKCNGKKYKRIRFGDEPLSKRDAYCHDCNARLGFFHHGGCDVERCPACGGQLVSCDCEIEFITK